jgi:hypothetical protein
LKKSIHEESSNMSGILGSAYLVETNPHQGCGLAKCFGYVAYTYSAMVGRPLRTPGVHESTYAGGKAVAAVGVAYRHNLACHALTFGHEQLETRIRVFHH